MFNWIGTWLWLVPYETWRMSCRPQSQSFPVAFSIQKTLIFYLKKIFFWFLLTHLMRKKKKDVCKITDSRKKKLVAILGNLMVSSLNDSLASKFVWPATSARKLLFNWRLFFAVILHFFKNGRRNSHSMNFRL